MSESFVTATYHVKTLEPDNALRAICRGQSVGNPTLRTTYETPTFLKQWCATGRILERRKDEWYTLRIRWPEHNFGHEGLSYLLSVVLGGQCDIDFIQSCQLTSLDLGSCARHFPKPLYGITGLRQLLQIPIRPLVGGIIKPKIGLSLLQLANVVKQMADGGCDVIKEDEILANQYWCPLQERVTAITKVLDGHNVIYLACITADGSEAWQKGRVALKAGSNGLHLNLWSGLGTFVDVRRHLAEQHPVLFFQKSGDKVWTTGPFSMDSSVLYQLAHLAGADIAHVGMYGGYLAEDVGTLTKRICLMDNTLPSFSCGLTPALAEGIIQHFGKHLLLMSGGWIHAQPCGISEAVKQLRRVADGAG